MAPPRESVKAAILLFRVSLIFWDAARRCLEHRKALSLPSGIDRAIFATDDTKTMDGCLATDGMLYAGVLFELFHCCRTRPLGVALP